MSRTKQEKNKALVLDALDTLFNKRDPEHNPMIPHVLVLEPGLIIFKIYNGYWFFGRPTIEELRQDLRAVLKKCHPDWDITEPERKAAWERGEHDRFYPYGKTYGQVFREQE